MDFLWLLLPFIMLGAGVCLFAFVHHRTLWALWHEPVLSHPVLIIESDDWGPGPISDVDALERLAQLLSNHQDHFGQPSVMTLGVVLAIPDGARIRDHDGHRYYRQTLTDKSFEPLRQALLNGVRQGVFSLQLHGMEHYWPESVMTASQNNTNLRGWLTSSMPSAEQLPDALQTRWCDCSLLPSRELDADTARQSAYEEAILFSRIFGEVPAVAVPPTFIWNDAVEDGWAQAGVRVVVSPGRRQEGRDANGRPVGPAPNKPDNLHLNGMHGRHGQIYLIRNAWFEPNRGHTAEQAIDIFARHVFLGRPVLFETHRSNFVGQGAGVERAFGELDALLRTALQRFPLLRFCSSEKLAKHLNTKNDLWVVYSFRERLTVFFRRILAHQPLHRLAVLTGTVLIARVGLRLSTRWQTT